MKVLFLLFIGLDRHETSEHLLTAVMEQLCLAGHHVHIVQKDTGGDLPSIPQALLKYPITTETIQFRKNPKNKLLSRYWAEIKYLTQCKKRIKQDYDAVFIQSTTVAGFAVYIIKKLLPKARIIFNVQDIFPYNARYSGKLKNKIAFRLLAKEQRYGYKHCDRIITISKDMKETLVSDGIDPKKIDVIYNWSYQDGLYENINSSKVSDIFKKGFFHVVYAGNVGVMQNVDICIEAANLMKDDKTVWFHIIGNGVYKDFLEMKAAKYGLANISFWPMQPPELAPAIYSAADVNVIPLAKDIYRTALPSKTATCMACQKPIIFAIGKNSLTGNEIIQETGCPLVNSDAPEELVKAIKAIQRGSVSPNPAFFFLNHMNKTTNSRRYGEIITGN